MFRDSVKNEEDNVGGFNRCVSRKLLRFSVAASLSTIFTSSHTRNEQQRECSIVRSYPP